MKAEYFAARLRELREQAGMTQAELAGKAGLTVRQISRFETGAQTATWPTAIALADALAVELTEFIKPPRATVKPARGRPVKGESEGGSKRSRARPAKSKAAPADQGGIAGEGPDKPARSRGKTKRAK